MDVIINGVRYVPATDASPHIDAITRGLIASFWGDVRPGNDALKEAMEGLCVWVNDSGEGAPIEEVIADIAKALDAAKGGA